MSKIEVTEYQAQELHTAWCAKEGVGIECYGATLEKAIELGLVRPASDDLGRTKEVVCQHQNKLNDLAARVAALEAKANTPDPHAAAKPRTEADRLGEVAYNEYWADDEVCSWEECHDDTRGQWSTIALAVRKAVIEGQLEPSEEEIDKACNAYLPHYAASTPSAVESVRRGVAAALRAAARVRLEKAEGEVQ